MCAEGDSSLLSRRSESQCHYCPSLLSPLHSPPCPALSSRLSPLEMTPVCRMRVCLAISKTGILIAGHLCMEQPHNLVSPSRKPHVIMASALTPMIALTTTSASVLPKLLLPSSVPKSPPHPFSLPTVAEVGACC